MQIRKDSKVIAEYAVRKLLETGDFNTEFAIQYDTLAHELGLGSEKYCRVCCQYLKRIGCLELRRLDDDRVLIRATAGTINLIETE